MYICVIHVLDNRVVGELFLSKLVCEILMNIVGDLWGVSCRRRERERMRGMRSYFWTETRREMREERE